MMSAPVNKIIHFSNVDGPGNRTSVFFQGCTFACRFCHNPETIRLCSHCGKCVPCCPANALRFEGGTVRWDSALCAQCDTCIHVCPESASPRVIWMTVEDVLSEIRRTAPYIDGVTVSGGECTIRHAFLEELFPKIRELGKTCLMDSNGSLDFVCHPRLLEVSDGVMLDIKAVNSSWCMQLLGNNGTLPLKNLDFLLSCGKLQEVRTVLFPDRPAENEETVRYVASHIGNACPYKLIRYRPFGVTEAGRQMLGSETTSQDTAEDFATLARSLGAAQAFVV